MRCVWLIAVLMVPLSLFSQQQLHVSKQQKFPKSVPAGNYSGITPLGNGRYAVVCDKSADGFYVFHIDIDTVALRIRSVAVEGYYESGRPCRDQESVAFVPASNTVFIGGEKDNRVLEYTMAGELTGRQLPLPENIRQASQNYGLESLAYSECSHRFFTVTERPLPGDSLLRILTFDDQLCPGRAYSYRLDSFKSKHGGSTVHGVSALCAVDCNRLLVLERMVHIPRHKLSASADCRIYELRLADDEPEPVKHRLWRVKTRMNLVRQNLANYEGLCVAHQLADGRYVLLLLADSQGQYRGLLRDWFRLVTVRFDT